MPERITGEEPTMAVSSQGELPLSVVAGVSTPPRHVFGGRYEILGLVGSGGMGTVYRARDAELDEVVALKLLRRDLLDQPGMLDRFRQEVKLARRVTHRNVARTFDIGEGDGEKFLTMEFVDGEALSARIAREGALPLRFVMEVATSMCAGLVAAHEAGIVHRDLKPDNVLIARDGRVVITDFGIARAVYDAGRAATVGLAIGTPAYMAPEQVEGAKDLDARTDIYALGTMLYECLTGERAWTGDSVWSLAAARLMQPPPDPRLKRPDLPPAAAELVLRCMARRREDRFASAEDAVAALAGLTMPASQTLLPSAPAAGSVHLDSGVKTVAVIPFRNAGVSDDAYIADGLTDDLIDALSMTSGLRVLARGAASRAGVDDAREKGRELRVDVVVDGTVRRNGGVLRVAARVISVADGFQLWAKRFDRPEKDVLAVSDEAADAIAEALTLHRSVPGRAAPSDARAVDLYLRARHSLHAGWRDDVMKAIDLFEQALALAPDDPTILSAYATAQLRRFTFSDGEAALDAEQKVRVSAEKALALAPHMGEARAALASLGWSMGDSVGCARQVREAIRVSPSNADVNELLGRLLLETGEPQRGIALLNAILALEPDRNLVACEILRGRALMGEWSAIDASIVTPPTDDQSNVRYITLARLAMWHRDRAVAAVLKRQVASRTFPLRDEVLTMLDIVETGKARQQIRQNIFEWGRVEGRARRRPIFFRQLASEGLAFVGDHAEALGVLMEADSLGLVDITWLDRCPMFDLMRTSAEFVGIRERVAARAKEALDVLEGRVD